MRGPPVLSVSKRAAKLRARVVNSPAQVRGAAARKTVARKTAVRLAEMAVLVAKAALPGMEVPPGISRGIMNISRNVSGNTWFTARRPSEWEFRAW